MDPQAALEAILSGHMMLDHVEALEQWLRRGGFSPAPVWRPVDVHPAFAELPFDTDISVDGRGLIYNVWVSPVTGEAEVKVAFTWAELRGIAEAAD